LKPEMFVIKRENDIALALVTGVVFSDPPALN